MHGTLKELILVKQHDKSLPKGVFKSASILNINWLSNRHVRVSATGHGKYSYSVYMVLKPSEAFASTVGSV